MLMRMRAEEKGLALVLDIADGVPRYLHGDAPKLRQILLNLLTNAVKYTSEGRVGLLARAENRDNEVALDFTVEDSGHGIPVEQQARIFDPFFQTESGQRQGEGTGLGLAICRQYADALGGDLVVTSTVGQGSRFSLRLALPLARGEAPGRAGLPQQILGLSRGQPRYKLLVAEDNPDNQRLITTLLQGFGFDVVMAANGREAVDRVRSERPDFVWMDMRMPEMDGYEATREIRNLAVGRDLPIVALTASAFVEDKARILAAGCDDMLRKPVDEEQLADVLERYLDVRFERGDPNTPPANEPTRPELGHIPVALRQALFEAAEQLDTESVEQVIATIAEQDPNAAQTLARLARDFRFDELIKLCDLPDSDAG